MKNGRTAKKLATLNKATHIMWSFFISLRLTFVLLGLIGIGAIVGMSFDQTLTFDEFYQNRNQDDVSGFLLSFFELYDAFHSWWFTLAILFLALNLIACSIERLPRLYFDFRRPRPYLSRRRFLGLSLKEELITSDRNNAEAMVKIFFGRRDLSRIELLRPGYFFKEQQGLGRFGVYIVHIALLIVMFSSIYATQKGVDGHVMIEEGKKARFITARGASGVNYTYDLGFYLGCEDFRLRTFVDNSPMEFESDLYISRNQDEKIVEKTVRVNEPLTYAGFTFYQSSFRPMISERVVEIEVANNHDYKKRHRVRLNSPIELPNKQTLVVEKIYEDFAGLGQALRIKKKNTDDESSFFHIFRRHKDFDQVVRGDEYFISFLDADQHYATGLSVGKMPGISIIFFGFSVLIVGLFMCFFMTPVRFFARIIDEENQTRVLFAAASFRNHIAVKEIFQKRLKIFHKE